MRKIYAIVLCIVCLYSCKPTARDEAYDVILNAIKTSNTVSRNVQTHSRLKPAMCKSAEWYAFQDSRHAFDNNVQRLEKVAYASDSTDEQIFGEIANLIICCYDFREKYVLLIKSTADIK